MNKLEPRVALPRRDFLVGLTGAIVTFGFAPERGMAEERASSTFEPTIWYGVDRDGIVTVNIIRAEMGQHIGTAIARIVADELKAGTFVPEQGPSAATHTGGLSNLGLEACGAELTEALAWVEDRAAFLERTLDAIWNPEHP